ncbi:MAG: hypothetical protein ACO1OB_13395 [Archangium sp.]
MLPIVVLLVSGTVMLAPRFGVHVTGIQEAVATVFAALAVLVLLLGVRRG